MKSVITRTITGIFFIAFVVWAIMYNPISLWALLALITGVSLYEFYKILFKGEFTTLQYLMHISAGIYLTTILWLEATMVMEASDSRAVTYAPYLLYVMIVFITELYAKHEEPFTYAAKSLAGHLYIALPVGLLSFIAFGGLSILSIYMPIMLLALLVIIWVYDTGAFVTGMTFGKHRLFERISPKKSWEGFWGGVALVVVVSATMGDLTESLLKRTYGVKDSGRILPGHGGMMDRFDSVFMAAPAAYIYLSLVM